jgi:hypothetical protein
VGGAVLEAKMALIWEKISLSRFFSLLGQNFLSGILSSFDENI